jgi:hypothetical protein
VIEKIPPTRPTTAAAPNTANKPKRT